MIHDSKGLDRNALGDRGELIFYLVATRFHGERPLFRPVLLGGKWPVADAAVELVGEPGMFFLVQVKTTTRGYKDNSTRLVISAERENLQSLADAPLPTYLVGVDEPGEQVFLTALHGRIAAGVASISTRHSLRDQGVRTRLYAEVKAFWEAVRQDRPWTNSTFIDDSQGDASDAET